MSSAPAGARDPGDDVHRRGRWLPPYPYTEVPAGVSDHGCWRGWSGEDDQARPIPCPTCRPHLLARERPTDDPTEHDDPEEDR